MRRGIRFWLVLSLSALLIDLLLVVTTSPLSNVAYAGIFFVVMLLFLIFAGHLLIEFLKGEVSLKNRNQIIIISSLFVLLLMFKSIQSLNWGEALILILAATGMLFYNSRRI